MIRFHLDQHIPLRVALALRRRGIDVTTALEVGLAAAADSDHLRFAHGEGRVVVTHDRDSLVLADQGVAHSGICFCLPRDRTPSEVVEALLLVHQCLSAEEIVGQVQFL